MSEVREGDTIKTDNTIAAALLAIKLREANALIDTLVEALELCHKKAAKWHPCDEASIKLHAALAEAKKWKGEV